MIGLRLHTDGIRKGGVTEAVPEPGLDHNLPGQAFHAAADGRFLYFYGSVGLKAIKMPGMEATVRKRFANRIIALTNGFASQAAHA
jgi:hypothetical protein